MDAIIQHMPPSIISEGGGGSNCLSGQEELSNLVTLSLKWISTNFPNLLLLLFLIVFALPNDSRRGLAKNQCTTGGNH